LVRGWDVASIHVNMKIRGSGGTMGGLQDMDMRLSPSSPAGQATWTRKTPGRRFVSRSAPDNAERGHSNVYSLASSSVPPRPHVHLVTWRG